MKLLAASPSAGFENPLPLPGESGLFGLLAPEGKVTFTAAASLGTLSATGAAKLTYTAQHKGKTLLNPILVLRKGQDFEATLVNGLTEPTIIHWHGVNGPWRQAGHPSYAVGPGGSYEYKFPITNRAGTYWYHPHPHGLTARQTYMGLASFFIVVDAEEESFAKELDLRLGETDIPVLIQDKRITKDGGLDYSPSKDDLLMGYLGGTVLANGANKPTMKVATRLYRLRLLNGSTARIYNLAFLHGKTRLPFFLVGNDGGFLPAPQQLSEVFLAPGERVDVLVDLRALAPGQEVFLQNMPFDPMHNEMSGMADMSGMGHESAAGHNADANVVLGESESFPILRLLVDRAQAYDRKLPEQLSTGMQPPTGSGFVRPIALALRNMSVWTINDLTFSMKDAPLVVQTRGPEIWQIRNATASMPHPMHLHGYFYRVLERHGSPPQVKDRAIDSQGRTATDLGFKDTVLVWPGETVSVEIDFSNPDYPGEQLFLFHCHNLEHEDLGMMLNVRVTG
jgi:FtsP/CotA-like multicopper oxidase with cupredoxin domain